MATEDLVYRLRKRAEIRRQIPGRKSVQEGKPDRVADLLEEAAAEIERLRKHQCPKSPLASCGHPFEDRCTASSTFVNCNTGRCMSCGKKAN